MDRIGSVVRVSVSFEKVARLVGRLVRKAACSCDQKRGHYSRRHSPRGMTVPCHHTIIVQSIHAVIPYISPVVGRSECRPLAVNIGLQQ